MKDNRTISEKKSAVLEELSSAKGIKSIAYTRAKVRKTTFFKWQKDDLVFASKIADIEERWVDVVEDQLLNLISMGDRAAIMFYLKAKGKGRGYR